MKPPQKHKSKQSGKSLIRQKSQNEAKRIKKSTKTPQVLFVLARYPWAWYTDLVRFHWRKLIFPSASGYQMQMASCLGMFDSYSLPAASSVWTPGPWGEGFDEDIQFRIECSWVSPLCTLSSCESLGQFSSTLRRRFVMRLSEALISEYNRTSFRDHFWQKNVMF